MKRLLLFIFGLITFCASGQIGKIPVKWGKFSKEELEMKSYKGDSTASAVILFKYGSVSYEEGHTGLETTYDYLIRIKIFNKNGFQYGNISIPFIDKNSYDRFSDFKAHTINPNPDGTFRESEVSKDVIFTEDLNGFLSLRKFAFPDLKEGSIIEYSYTIKSYAILSLKRFDFQNTIPIAWCELRTSIPQICKYTVMTKGLEGVTFVERGTSLLNNWVNDDTRYVFENVSGLNVEPYSIHPSAYFSNLSMQLNNLTLPGVGSKPFIKDWPALGRYVMDADWFGKQIRNYSLLDEIVTTAIGDAKDSLEKVKRIYDYVKSNYVWNKFYSFYIGDLKKCINNKSGNGTEINSILICLLRKAGFNADPLLICTRDEGDLQKAYSFLSQINHTLAFVDLNGKELILDATDPIRSANLVDNNCIGISGYLVNEKNSRWVDIKKPSPSKCFLNYSLALSKSDLLSGSISYSSNNYEGLENSKKIKEKGLSNFFTDYLNSDKLNIKTDSVVLSYSDQTNNSISIKSLVNYSLNAEGNFVYITPLINPDLQVNPFKSETRQLPVEFLYPVNKTSIFNITIPEGYKVSELPKGMIISMPDKSASFTYMSSGENGQVQIKTILTIDRLFYPAEEYEAIRSFFSNISKVFAGQIVISKT